MDEMGFIDVGSGWSIRAVSGGRLYEVFCPVGFVGPYGGRYLGLYDAGYSIAKVILFYRDRIRRF